jgi:hypothetical protein
MLESDKMGATCALSVGNHQFDATVKVRQNVRMLVSTNFDRLRGLESENVKLKKLLADAMLNNAALKDLLAKKNVWSAPSVQGSWT